MDDHQSDAETRMRHNLRLPDASKPSPAMDPQRLARQAIRSQAAARDYAERQLVRAEQTIQDQHRKLHALGREKDIAISAARMAHTAQAHAERGLRAAEAALIHEKALSNRARRDAEEARATIHELRTKLALAHQKVAALQSQMEEERQARIAAEQERKAAQASTAVSVTGDAPSNQPLQRKRGPSPGKREVSAPARPAPKTRKAYSDKQQPVKWWTDDWKPA